MNWKFPKSKLQPLSLALACALLAGCNRQDRPTGGGAKQGDKPTADESGPYQGAGPGMGEKGTGYGGQGATTDSVGKPAPRGTTR